MEQERQVMTPDDAKQTLDKIFGQVFGYENPYEIDEFMQRFAFDVRLPQQVVDNIDGSITWAQSLNPTSFVKLDNVREREWEMPKEDLGNIQDILQAWKKVNMTSTERQIDSLNIAESDNIYGSQNIFRSLDVSGSKNVVFSDGAHNCEFVVGIQRSNTSNFCIRVEDSKECSKSFSVSWSGKVVNSLFIHDSYDLFECMFCSHLSSKKFCIANQQFSEEEYFKLKDQVIRWILSS